MSEPLFVRSTIAINAPAEKIWDVLTNPQQTRKYMFGCETISDWKVGSPLLWQMEYEGKDFIPVKGTITAIEPGKYLAYTTIDPNDPSMPDIPENYLTVTYDLTTEGDHTILNVAQGDYSKVAAGEKRYTDTLNGGEGWTPILVQIKAIAEGE